MFLALLLIPLSLLAAEPYSIHRLSEKEILQTYTRMLREACHYADRDWQTATNVPDAGYWGDGISAGNEGIRTVGSMVLACATEIKYDDALTADERKDFLAKVTEALRYIVATHNTGAYKCPDGKHWGATENFDAGSWQSGMWTGTFGFGAWLIWDRLDPELQQGLERVIGWEDDILSHRPPPNNLWLDTKAEENGWEVPCLVLGDLMFPNNPHAAAWHEGAIKYMMNTLCTADDLNDTNLADGRPVNQWVTGANLQPDFTLENHNRFHPSYVGCSSYFMTQAQMYYTYAGRPVPDAATHHVLDTWHMFQTIILPWGESAYPQGMDWELHGLPFINLFATLGTHAKDPFAARMEQQSLQYLGAWQKMCNGSLALPGSRFGITRHAINAEQLSFALAAHQVFGPSVHPLSAWAAAEQEEGLWDRPFVDFIEQRTLDKFASFSWKNHVMGVLMPIEDGHEDNPDFTVPIQDGFVGSFQLAPRGDAKSNVSMVIEQGWRKADYGFETDGSLLINGGRLKQELRMISLGSQTVVYEDHIIAQSNLTVKAECGLPLGIENDEITGGTRVLSTHTGHVTFDWHKPQKPVVVSGSWANVDGRLGVVMISGQHLVYAQASGYSPGICVCTDTLYGSYSDQTRKFKAGEEVAHHLAVCAVEVSPRETAKLAKSCRIENTPQGPVLHFKQPDGTDTEIPL
jgi:hypothetical protein